MLISWVIRNSAMCRCIICDSWWYDWVNFYRIDKNLFPYLNLRCLLLNHKLKSLFFKDNHQSFIHVWIKYVKILQEHGLSQANPKDSFIFPFPSWRYWMINILIAIAIWMNKLTCMMNTSSSSQVSLCSYFDIGIIGPSHPKFVPTSISFYYPWKPKKTLVVVLWPSSTGRSFSIKNICYNFIEINDLWIHISYWVPWKIIYYCRF